ncbi:unnamed protein product, partial [Pylaiella littoralis]
MAAGGVENASVAVRTRDLLRQIARVWKRYFTAWVAIAEYVTAGVGNRRKVDAATRLNEFEMRQKLTFFPALAIRRVMHVMHACPTSGGGACGLVVEGRKRPRWRSIQ